MGNIKIVADLVFIHEIFSQCYNTFSLVHAYGASTSQASAEFKIICTRTHVDVGSGFTACGLESDSCKCSYSFSVVPSWLGKTNLTLTGNNITQLQNLYNTLLKTNVNETVLTKVTQDFSQFKNIEKHRRPGSL
jgi:hypothetical protein